MNFNKLFVSFCLGLFIISFTSAFNFGDTTSTINNINIINESEVEHNNMSGLQGGVADEYYHIRVSWYNELLSDIFDWITQAEGDVRYYELTDFSIGDYSTTAEAGALYSTIDEPLWTANYSAYNDSWSSTTNTSYYLASNPDSFIDWAKATNGTLATWAQAMNGTLFKTSQWNATNTSYYLASNPSEYIDWAKATNGTLMSQATYDSNYTTLMLQSTFDTNYSTNDPIYRSWSLNYSDYLTTKAYALNDSLWTSNYTATTLALPNNLAVAKNLTVDTNTLFVNSVNHRVGIGTTSPAYPLMVNKSVSGISIYALNNMSAEDYLYHSPFPADSYTNTQALIDLLKIKGSNGKINYSTMPVNTQSIQNIPTYNTTSVQKTKEVPVMENITYTEQSCSYVDKDKKGKYKYICVDITKTKEQQKQDCKNKSVEEFVLIENSIDYEKVKKDVEVCTPVTITENYIEDIQTQNGTRDEPQTSVGMLLGNIVKSIQRMFDWNTEQDVRIKKMEVTLCSDGHLEYCIK